MRFSASRSPFTAASRKRSKNSDQRGLCLFQMKWLTLCCLFPEEENHGIKIKFAFCRPVVISSYAWRIRRGPRAELAGQDRAGDRALRAGRRHRHSGAAARQEVL